MAVTPSSMRDLGTAAPDFSLKSTEGKTVSRGDFAGKPLLVMFICNHCPYVKHLRSHLAGLGKEYQQKGVAIVGINSNDPVNYPDDNFAKMVDEVRRTSATRSRICKMTRSRWPKRITPRARRTSFCTTRATSWSIAASTTPAGPTAASRSPGADLKAALDAVLAGKPVPPIRSRVSAATSNGSRREVRFRRDVRRQSWVLCPPLPNLRIASVVEDSDDANPISFWAIADCVGKAFDHS